MQNNLKYYLGAFALIALASPAWARTDEMMLHLDNTTMVGTTQLSAGDYDVKADENKKDLKIIKDDKVVADVQGHWVDLSAKPDYDQAVIDSNRVLQVEFGGQIKSFVIG